MSAERGDQSEFPSKKIAVCLPADCLCNVGTIGTSFVHFLIGSYVEQLLVLWQRLQSLSTSKLHHDNSVTAVESKGVFLQVDGKDFNMMQVSTRK